MANRPTTNGRKPSALSRSPLTQARWQDTMAGPEDAALLGMFVALVGVLYSAYLTWLEIFVTRTISQRCVANAILITLFLIVPVLRVGRATGVRAKGKSGVGEYR